ncbi:hypothetical protein GOBAR_AA07760 [Gossypium barbadense]|uniref:Cyanobacterial aminoacyl-tRNA synthetase CAAD domain-containing protein n=1 Tax=Gossypium barbadense TaxID=3634 RepID=A0A2P5YBG6_GOSBA|nr:hypothetical protein GOBAR_AA07760 [Gossypium barbadense]
MASLTAHLLPPLLLQDRKTLFRTYPKLPVSYTGGVACQPAEWDSTMLILWQFQCRNLFGLKTENVWQLGRQNCAVCVKATGDSSESSTSLSIVKSVRHVWDKSDEDRVGLIGLGFAAIVALWTSTNLISVIDKLPIIPNVLEIIGILFSSWFIYRYLLFKPDREELFEIINKSLSQIFG